MPSLNIHSLEILGDGDEIFLNIRFGNSAETEISNIVHWLI